MVVIGVTISSDVVNGVAGVAHTEVRAPGRATQTDSHVARRPWPAPGARMPIVQRTLVAEQWLGQRVVLMYASSGGLVFAARSPPHTSGATTHAHLA